MDYMFMTRPFWLEFGISAEHHWKDTRKNGFTVKKRKCLLSGERLI